MNEGLQSPSELQLFKGSGQGLGAPPLEANLQLTIAFSVTH